MIRSVPPSVVDISMRGRDLQKRHAERLLLSGYDAPSVAVMTGLSIADVQKIVEAADLQIRPSRP